MGSALVISAYLFHSGTFGVVCKATLVNDSSTDGQLVAVKMARSKFIQDL